MLPIRRMSLRFFGMMIKKGRNFDSGVRFSESARSVYSPMGYRSKELSKKDGILTKNVFGGEISIFDFEKWF